MAIVVACVVVSMLFTLFSGTWAHWLPLGLAFLVSYWALVAINRR
jgi:hypothetical protein